MKLIVGLGNPGPKFKGTRHNTGFEVIDEIAQRHNAKLDQFKYNSQYSVIHVNEQKIMLLKPLTYMNLSGESIKPMMDYFHVNKENLIVIHNDLDLPLGKIRLRQKGSAGGHNGMKSTIAQLGTQQFNRIRVGIDRPPFGMSVSDYVLGEFSKEERMELSDVIDTCANACEDWFSKSFIEVMNLYN
ncbi:aminoacyl-tRNA hydrolase [Bacillus solimangrovi]|uniref:Peptidyl-tRNA hydrolase n=1 Tax=Bacillus solimangrovi TaxID=1305675 RepID=A0A1E5LFD3_9BACI|nr:aminoacyl-tRNA hydrolase [Bacillus solimangrovi]OEH92766.1 aminoacyl-tRNA hydrolase [Bacillus solimangrovi]